MLWRIVDSLKGDRISNTDNDHHQKKREGEVKVEYQPPKKNNKDDEEGEYVDYEEIK